MKLLYLMPKVWEWNLHNFQSRVQHPACVGQEGQHPIRFSGLDQKTHMAHNFRMHASLGLFCDPCFSEPSQRAIDGFIKVHGLHEPVKSIVMVGTSSLTPNCHSTSPNENKNQLQNIRVTTYQFNRWLGLSLKRSPNPFVPYTLVLRHTLV